VQISAVIIAKNEARTIAKCVQAAKTVCCEVLVLENGSTDDTAQIATRAGARVVQCDWLGYGATKNFGHQLAKSPWILSLDADEYLDEQLCNSISAWTPRDNYSVCVLTRHLIWQGKQLRFGLAKEQKLRLFHRDFAAWNLALVHEQIIVQGVPNKVLLKGVLHHDAYSNELEADVILKKYAKLWAEGKKAAGKTSTDTSAKWRGAASYFIQVFLRGAWLDGAAGLSFARKMAEYTKRKYSALAVLSRQ
jgi:glycosyltransferase involved in cell wall biosynthesis